MNELDIYITVALSCAALILMACGFLFINFSMNKERLSQKLREKELNLKYEQELRNIESEIRDATFEYISWELHDNIQHSLTHLRFQVEDIKRKNDVDTDALNNIEETIFEATDQLRNLSNRLKPDFVTANNFLKAFELEIMRLKRLGRFQVQWEHDDVLPDVTNERLLIVFRIFQEMINNVLKHSDAQNLYISLNCSQPMKIWLKDDGKGFVAENYLSNGRGLQNMQRRSELAGFKLSINTAPGNGCEYMLTEMDNAVTNTKSTSRNNTFNYATTSVNSLG